jgi:hypothetical protein
VGRAEKLTPLWPAVAAGLNCVWCVAWIQAEPTPVYEP